MPFRLTLRILCAAALLPVTVWAQGSAIPDDIRSEERAIARGILDGNLIETNFRNHAEFSRFDDLPWGVWPRNVGGRHIDGVAMMVAGSVNGERAKWPQFFGAGVQDTTVNPVILTYRDAGKTQGPDGSLWGWLPLPGFNNPDRTNPITFEAEPTPALSDDPTSWPIFWPDRIDNIDDPGWRNDDVDNDPQVAAWNGLFGKGVFNADLETFYVVDDYSDQQYTINQATGLPFDADAGIFYPDPADSTKAGFGLQAQVRGLQWANVLAEDVMFILYRITNTGGTDHDSLFFSQVMDYGLGSEEGDENAAYDPQQDVVFGWDQDGLCQETVGTGQYECGYTGFAFLESPARAFDALDNDEDGITDESRFGGPGMLVEGQNQILAAAAVYNLLDFETFYGPVTERPAYQAGRWWTGDENLDWVGFSDDNDNGIRDDGELLNNDVGGDGLGPFDLGYPGPDTGEGDGIPTRGEPNFDELDVDESDQIGLTGFDLNTRPFYENGDNLRSDDWLWDRIINVAQFEVGQEPEAFAADIEPFIVFSSGPVELGPQQTDFFSTAWIFGEDEDDFFKNRRVVQNIYNADYNFAQPPLAPTLTAVPGDGRVVLSWDTLSIASFDRFCQTFDFEGFKLYRGTDPLLLDSRTITDVDGTATFYEPLVTFDIPNGVQGPVTVFNGEAIYDVGEDNGLNFYYVDENVTNGVTYYYALVAYDRGCGVFDLDEDGQLAGFNGVQASGVGPQENTFNVSVTLAGDVVGVSKNAAVVTPRSRAAGYTPGGTDADLTTVTGGRGTGAIGVNVVDDMAIRPESIYEVRFYAEQDTINDALYNTTAYDIFDITTQGMLVERADLGEVSPLTDGFVVEFFNETTVAINPERTGYVSNRGTPNEITDLDPTTLDGYSTNWVATVARDTSSASRASAEDYELRWVNPADSLYQTPRFISSAYNFLFLFEVPVFAVNPRTGETLDVLIDDVNDNGEFDVEDTLIIAEERDGGGFTFRYLASFEAQGGASQPPQPGAALRASVTRPFDTGDFFQFSVNAGGTDASLAESELDRIAVVPNPYVGASIFERRSQVVGRGERRIQFVNLPPLCTIRIFNIRGELVKRLEHDSFASDGSEFWDLRTDGGQDVAYGVYIYHVEAPGVGETTGKLALVK
ncbi:MAG: hypothetical protein AAF624_01555 [Bacteroidota bacterium]